MWQEEMNPWFNLIGENIATVSKANLLQPLLNHNSAAEFGTYQDYAART